MPSQLATFQAIVIAVAAAMIAEAIKPTHARRTRIVFFVTFGVLALVALTTNQIASAWPAASSVMSWIGSSPFTLLGLFIVWLAYTHRRQVRPHVNSGEPHGGDADSAFTPAPIPEPAAPRARFTESERERVTRALGEVEDFLRDRVSEHLRPLAVLGGFQSEIAKAGPMALHPTLLAGTEAAQPFAEEIRLLLNRYDTELKMVGVDLLPVYRAAELVWEPLRDAAAALGKLSPELRDSDLVAPFILRANERVGMFRGAATQTMQTVQEKRLAISRGEL